MTKEQKEQKAAAESAIAELAALPGNETTVNILRAIVNCVAVDIRLDGEIQQLQKDQSAMREHLMRLARRVDCI